MHKKDSEARDFHLKIFGLCQKAGFWKTAQQRNNEMSSTVTVKYFWATMRMQMRYYVMHCMTSALNKMLEVRVVRLSKQKIRRTTDHVKEGGSVADIKF